MINKVERK